MAVACQRCGFSNPADFRFCGSCGGPLTRACPSCGSEVATDLRFCGICGAELTQPASATDGDEAGADTAADADEGERRRVAVLFADLVGFSTMAEFTDPEELQAMMTETFAELSAIVETRGGRVEKFIGDAVMATFGAPIAHEDDPQRAVEAGLSMLEAIHRRSEYLELRIGVNTGLVVSGRVGDGSQTGVLGDAVNVAARMQQAAAPGEVLVAAPVWRRIRHLYETRSIGPLEVKGRAQRVHAYEVKGRLPAASRRATPFVGRGEELALLELLWSSAERGNTHVVSVVGEPGVGKSRLLAEFPARLDGLDARITCGSERAYGPFLELVERVLGRLPGSAEDLRSQMADLGVDEEVSLLVGALLGVAGAPPVVAMADEQQKRQVFAGVWQFFQAAAQGKPALVVMDDVHWADRSSLDLLGFLLERMGGMPLMVVLAYRPGFDHVERTTMRASHTGVRLEPLTPDESVALARGALGVDELPADLARIVAEQAEGNPFFIEELLQALLELESLAVVNGRAVLAKVEVQIPDTVQGAILARIDRLKPRERSVLQHAAVIGRHFSADLLQEILGGQDVGPTLTELFRAQLLVSDGPDRWTFKHALIQEVVYETLLIRQRREIHRKTAEALEARAGDDPAFLEQLAEHYASADVAEKARRYALAAGDMAADRMGFVEAQARYETALRLWGEGDEEGRLDLLYKLGYSAHMCADAATARTALIEAASGWTTLGDQRRAGSALATLGRVYFFAGDSDRAAEVLRRAIELLEPGGPSPELVRAYQWLAILSLPAGNVTEGMEVARRGLAIAEKLNLDAHRSHLLTSVGVFEVLAGNPAGVSTIRSSLELAEQCGEVEAIGRAYFSIPHGLNELYECREALPLAVLGREKLRKLGAPGYEWFIASKQAEALVELGRFEDAEELCREMLGPQRPVMVTIGILFAQTSMARLLIRRGRYQEAREVLDDMLPLARRVDGSMFLSRALGAEAELEHARGNHAAARMAIDDALGAVLGTTAVAHWFVIVVPSAIVLPPDRARDVIERVRAHVTVPMFEAVVLEAEGLVERDEGPSRKAADLYASLGLPYQEARARLEAGDRPRATELIHRFGLQAGPIGQRLAELDAS